MLTSEFQSSVLTISAAKLTLFVWVSQMRGSYSSEIFTDTYSVPTEHAATMTLQFVNPMAAVQQAIHPAVM